MVWFSENFFSFILEWNNFLKIWKNPKYFLFVLNLILNFLIIIYFVLIFFKFWHGIEDALLNRSTVFLPLNSLCRINVSFSVQMWFFVFFWFVLSESESEEKRCVWIRCGQVSKERVIVQVSWSIEGSGDFGA